eukprot:Gregarina_sp_Pseudo_9__5280@NODE_607_length_2498_cov_19_251728_g573_i0_p2_GENE_NODE_607_length_2498_cov_19_251728_g573_i0NODE_607_length_2498_cov_19_251728_g573_i0_p2_ORF_typecomplete_len341_score56_38_NODE_607_length_2498_cov_19_251728_g573_i014272449
MERPWDMERPWARCFSYKLPLPPDAQSLRQAPNYSFILLPKEVQLRMLQHPYSFGMDVATDSPLTPPLGLSPASVSADGPPSYPSADAMMDNSVCMSPMFWHPPVAMPPMYAPFDTNEASMEFGFADEDEEQRANYNSCKGMVQISAPRPEHTEHRMRVQRRVEKEMDEYLFTLKCRIYKDELHGIIKEIGRNEAQRSCISSLGSCPTITLNLAERQTLNKLGDMRTIMQRKGSQPAAPASSNSFDEFAKNLDDTFTELLNSLSNRLLFYVLIEYRSWFPQDRARGQIVEVIQRALFGEELLQVRSAAPDVVKYIEAFVVQRTKNFRDVISRVLKREKSK